MNDLILNRAWNVDLIFSLFSRYIAKEICVIPIPSEQFSNERYWKFDSKEKYSVREGYKLAITVFDSHANFSAQSLS